jgi:hypothetical protein
MARYLVIYNGQQNKESSERETINKFASAYNIDFEQARSKFTGPGALIYAVEHSTEAEKALSFLESIGAKAEIKDQGPTQNTSKPFVPIPQSFTETPGDLTPEQCEKIIRDTGSEIKFWEPKHFQFWWRVGMNLFGAVPQMVIIVYLLGGMWIGGFQVYFFILVSGTIIFLASFIINPLFDGNVFLPRFFDKRGPGKMCQITYMPRRYKGFLGVLEDADDFGYANVEGDFFVFRGESSKVMIHRNSISCFKSRNAGWRSFWIAGAAADITLIHPLGGVHFFTVTPRSGATLFGQRKAARLFSQQMEYFMSFQSPNSPPPIPHDI